jgi:NAD(P)-dependent dehydrogenase (short-subunit alcohol dehydrogenase family)
LIDLKNKLILVTGSGTGVGSGIATTFAKCGADIVVHYNSSKKEAEKTMSAPHLAKVVAIPLPTPVPEPVTRINLFFKSINSYLNFFI